MRRWAVPLLLGLVLVAAGCGGDDSPSLADRARERIERVRDRAEERLRRIRGDAQRVGDRIAARVERVLEDLQPTVPRAGPGTAPPTSRGRTETGTIDAFLTDVLRRIDRYWTRTLAASGVPEPRVSYNWIPPGRAARSRCGALADDRAAFYCPADDTIYVGQRLAAELFQGVARGFPGQEAGYGRAVGDFGVAYIVAHEYAHNLQDEFGFFSLRPGRGAKPFELQADCMAGLWGNSVYRAGLLRPGDVEEAMNTALAVGDFDYDNENHHGTPSERRDAWLLGYESGDPAVCRHFVRA